MISPLLSLQACYPVLPSFLIRALCGFGLGIFIARFPVNSGLLTWRRWREYFPHFPESPLAVSLLHRTGFLGVPAQACHPPRTPHPIPGPPSLSCLCLFPAQLWVGLKQILSSKGLVPEGNLVPPSHGWADSCQERAADEPEGGGIWVVAGPPGGPAAPENSSGGLSTHERVKMGFAESRSCPAPVT